MKNSTAKQNHRNKRELGTHTSSSQNSLINCLHIPHGLAGGLMSVLTAIALIFGKSGLSNDATSGANAHRSAHVPTGVLATSTLLPVKNTLSEPSERDVVEGVAIKMHEPTRKLL